MHLTPGGTPQTFESSSVQVSIAHTAHQPATRRGRDAASRRCYQQGLGSAEAGIDGRVIGRGCDTQGRDRQGVRSAGGAIGGGVIDICSHLSSRLAPAEVAAAAPSEPEVNVERQADVSASSEEGEGHSRDTISRNRSCNSALASQGTPETRSRVASSIPARKKPSTCERAGAGKIQLTECGQLEGVTPDEKVVGHQTPTACRTLPTNYPPGPAYRRHCWKPHIYHSQTPSQHTLCKHLHQKLSTPDARTHHRMPPHLHTTSSGPRLVRCASGRVVLGDGYRSRQIKCHVPPAAGHEQELRKGKKRRLGRGLGQ